MLLSYHIQFELNHLPIWSENTEGDGFENNRIKVIEAIKRQEIDAHLKPSETFSFAGVIASTEKTIEIINQVNGMKDLFKSAVTQYRRSEVFIRGAMPASKLLERGGYPGIKVRQVARHLQFIDYHPRRVAWSEAKGCSNIIITQEQAIKKLLEAGRGEHITYQIDLLKRLEPSEKLVVQRKIKAYPSANISTFKTAGRCSIEKIESSLPIFFKYDQTKRWPVVEYSIKQVHPQRIDKKLEDEPFLTSISAYRYKPKQRKGS